MDINDFITKNYSRLAKLCPDEDIFHDTLIKCITHYDGVSEPENYIRHAYKINTIREKQYSYNKCRSDAEIPESHYSESFAELDNILSILNSNFNNTLVSLYIKHKEGEPVDKLEQNYNMKSLYYKFKAIDNFISKLNILENRRICKNGRNITSHPS